MKKFRNLGLIIILIFSLITIPIFAESKPIEAKQQVVIDGREIFKVGGYELFPADSRADWINAQIKEVVDLQQKPLVRIEQSNQSPIIILNDRYLLTVTEQDTELGLNPQQQANLWADKITQTIEKAQTERNKSYLLRGFLASVIILIWMLVFHLFLGRFWKRSQLFWIRILQLEENDSESKEFKALKLVLNSTLLLTRLGLWTTVSLYISNLFPLTRVWSYQITNTLINTFTITLISIGNNSYSIIDFLILITLLIVLFLVANTAANLLRNKILNFTQIDIGIREAISVVAKYIVISIGTIVLLQVWGFDLSSLTIFASAIGVAIGFGFQDIAKNFGSGLVLLFERPIKVGDLIEVGKYSGIVQQIGARSTLIKTADEVSIIVPNSRFLENEVINWSHENSLSRVRLSIGVSYNSDVKLVRIALLESVKNCPDVLSLPEPLVLFKGFADSYLDFELFVWIQDPSRQLSIKSELFFAINDSFKRHQIEIPYPQQELHLRSGQIPLQLSSELENKISKLLEKNN